MTMIERIGPALRAYAMFGKDNGKGDIEWFILSTADPSKDLAMAKQGTGIIDLADATRAEMAANARAVLEVMREPTKAMIEAANALPVTKKVDTLVTMTAMRYGGISGLEGKPNTPLEQWYRAMIDAALAEPTREPSGQNESPRV